MKIREIDVAGLRGMTPPGGWSRELQPADVVHSLVVVRTDDGPSGLGSVFSSDALVRAAVDLLRPLIIGENALEPERVSEKLRQHTFWLGRGGSVTHAISGIDIALWDILGQACGQPVGRLMGGRYRRRVRPYASVLMREPSLLAAELNRLHAQGFRAFKIGWGPFGRVSRRTDEEIVAAARQAVGPDAQLMVDAGASDAFWPHGLAWAKRTAAMLTDYDIEWFEEPLSPDRLQDHSELRRSARIAIAGGEVLTRRQSFAPWFEAAALDVVQPDVTKVGGLSEQRRIAWAASDAGVRFVGHGWNTAIGLAADLQLASALPDTGLVEYCTGSPYIDELTVGGFSLDSDGYLDIPDRPGLGVELDPDAVLRFTGEKELSHA